MDDELISRTVLKLSFVVIEGDRKIDRLPVACDPRMQNKGTRERERERSVCRATFIFSLPRRGRKFSRCVKPGECSSLSYEDVCNNRGGRGFLEVTEILLNGVEDCVMKKRRDWLWMIYVWDADDSFLNYEVSRWRSYKLTKLKVNEVKSWPNYKLTKLQLWCKLFKIITDRPLRWN